LYDCISADTPKNESLKDLKQSVFLFFIVKFKLRHYQDFPSLSNLRQIEFRERWIEMHSPQEEQHKPEGMPQNR
jgi:hypothetical protein